MLSGTVSAVDNAKDRSMGRYSSSDKIDLTKDQLDYFLTAIVIGNRRKECTCDGVNAVI
jgi:hypothetical protein